MNEVGNSGHDVDVTPGNSVLLTAGTGPSPVFSDQNGHFVSWGYDPADPAVLSTLTFPPGDGRQLCVGGFTGAHEYHARFYVGIELLDACGNERFTWAPGETIHLKVSGGLTFNDPGECGANVSFATPAGATCDHAPGSFFSVGTTSVVCTAGTLSCDFDVTVTDDEAPAVSAVTASPNVLWPPNHQMVDVTLSYSASDNCGDVACSIVSITNDETGAADAEIVDATHIRLRSERLGTGDGRTYTIALDCGGELRDVQVTVPKSQKK